MNGNVIETLAQSKPATSTKKHPRSRRRTSSHLPQELTGVRQLLCSHSNVLWRRIKSMTTMLDRRSEGTKLLAPPDERAVLPERASSQSAVSLTTLFATDAAHNEAERFAEF